MSCIEFDFTNMTAVKNGVPDKDIAAAKKAAPGIAAALEEKRHAHTWRALPATDEALIADMEAEAARINRDFDSFVVLGIGGSALGSRAMFTALKHLKYNELPREKRNVRFYVADNVDPDGLSALFDVIDPEKTVFHVITKSGNTVETVTQFMLASKLISEKVSDIKNNIIVTTDKEKGNVKRIADECGFKTYVVPDGVGGRFSVFSPVGLLSAAVLGIDIREMLKGAADMDELASRPSLNENPAFMYAALTMAAMKNGANINVMMPYADALKDTSEWFCQLWAESLGKRYALDGSLIETGQTPVRAVGVTDQHSQVQLYTEGPYDKLITFIEVKNYRTELEIPKAPVPVYDAEYLAGQSFNKLILSELYATRYAVTRSGKMNLLISLEKLDEYSFGALIMFFEVATAAAGEFLAINAFDQPGVEEGKLATFALMGREGYEKKAEEMKAAKKEDESLKFVF